MTTTHTHTYVTPTRYFFDTEFMEDGKTVDLLSIGIVCEDGREFYRVNKSANRDKANDWVRANVFPSLDEAPADLVVKRDEIAHDLELWIAGGDSRPQFWAYYGDYDWVVLCQMFGTMMDLPKGWPMFAMDVKQLCVMLGDPELPKQLNTEHDALHDARWTKSAHDWLLGRRRIGALSFDKAAGA